MGTKSIILYYKNLHSLTIILKKVKVRKYKLNSIFSIRFDFFKAKITEKLPYKIRCTLDIYKCKPLCGKCKLFSLKNVWRKKKKSGNGQIVLSLIYHY